MRNAQPIQRIGLGLVVAVAAALALLLAAQAQATRWVSHTRDVRQQARILLTDLLNAETGQRGYLLARANPAYLGPYLSGSSRVAQSFAALDQLTADNPVQQQHLAAMKPLIDARLDELAQTVRLAHLGQVDAAVARVNTGRGKSLMDQLRARISAFIDTEESLLAERQARAARIRVALVVFIFVSLFSTVLLSAFLGRATLQSIAELEARKVELETEIARREKAENTLRQVHKMEAVGQLTGGIAHDFNNLLTVILGNLDTLKRRLPGEASPLAKPVDHALQGARSAAQLTQRLLAFSRRQMLTPKPLDLNRLITDMSDMLRRALGEAVDVETVLAGGLWQTFADANQVENALLNLAINARDAMPKGGRLTIETANAALDDAYTARFGDIAAGQYVLLIVSDTGCGIAPDIVDRVFEPFFTTKADGGGSGLGLSMVYGFVRQSGGHVRIYSELGHGTAVKIYLPRLIEAKEPASAPGPVAESAAPVEHAPRDEVILIVEDNAAVREYAASALAELGYGIKTAEDGAAALAVLESGARVDLLFTDVVLPGGMSGRDLAGRVHALRPDLPVLYTTGYTRNAIVHGGRLDAGVQLLHKPYTLHELARKVRDVLERLAVQS